MKILPTLSVLSMAVCFTVVSAQDADPVDKLQQAYEQALDLAAEPLKDLDANYTGALSKLKDKVQKKGDLQKTLKIQNEIENYAKPGERNFVDLPDLQHLREIYDQSRPGVLKEVQTKQLDILMQSVLKFEQLTTDLTKQGKLKDAVRSSETQEKLKASIEKMLDVPVEEGFEEWLERVTFLTPGGTKFEYRKGKVAVIRANGKNENNKATIGLDQKIEFEISYGPAYIQVEPDRKSAVYILKSRPAKVTKLRINDPTAEQ